MRWVFSVTVSPVEDERSTTLRCWLALVWDESDAPKMLHPRRCGVSWISAHANKRRRFGENTKGKPSRSG